MSAIITGVIGRRVWDSRGRPTIEADVVLANGAMGRAIAPAGASRGSKEAIELRDGGTAFGGMGVERAVASVVDEIASKVTGIKADNQASLDNALIELDGTEQKSRLGGNALIAVSMAAAHAAAASAGVPLWQYLACDRDPTLPMPMVQIFGGGAHAGRRLDLQDYLVVPVGAESFEQAIVMSAEVYRAAGLIMAEEGRMRGVADEGGWWPEFENNEQPIQYAVRAIERAGYRAGEDVAIALDIASSQFRVSGGYRFAAEDEAMDRVALIERLSGWCRRYPIISIEDPLAEDDDAGMAAVTEALGREVQIIGDDYLVTSAKRMRAAATSRACNAVLLKPNQAGTLTETVAAFRTARELGWRNIVSARSGETEDVTIVHLAIGWGAEQLKVGSFARSERMAKWNEGIRIEQAAKGRARFKGRGAVGGSGVPLP